MILLRKFSLSHGDNRDKLLSFTILLMLSFTPILLFVKTFLSLFGFENMVVDTWVLYLIFFAFIVISLLIVILNLKKDILIFLMSSVFIFLLTYLFYEENIVIEVSEMSDYLSHPLYVFFVYGFLAYSAFRNIRNYELFMKYFKIFSILIVITSAFAYIISLSNETNFEYMTFSYNLLPFVIFLFLFSKIHRLKLTYFIGLIGFVLIFLSGARGPLIILIISLLLFFISFFRVNIKNIIRILLFIFLVLMLFIYWQQILSIFSNLLISVNIESRNLQYILNDMFFSDSGRIAIIEEGIRNINVLGYGLYGDRVILSGNYVHNLFLELILHFGIIFGLVFIILIIYMIFTLIKNSNINVKILFIVFISTGFLKLLITSSYLLIEPSFYILLGMAMSNQNQIYKKNKKSQ